MAQEASAFAHRGEIQHVAPKASTDLHSGDYVAMARNVDPISRAVLGTESRISPVDSAYKCQWGIGIVDSDFNTNTVGATLYAAPTVNESLPVIRRGIVRLAISDTSGKAGDLVIYSSGASGAQVFKVNNFRRDVAVGRIFKDFSGATANDLQQVELIEKPISEKDVYFWLGNGIRQGCVLKKHSVAGQASSQIMAGATNEHNVVAIKGKVYQVARVTDFVVGAVAPGASDIRFYWVAAKVSTTGAAIAWTKETCTGPFTAIASWTNSVVSIGMMIPITWTSNMVPVGLVLAWSATAVTIASNRILMVDGGGMVPHGGPTGDQTKWHL